MTAPASGSGPCPFCGEPVPPLVRRCPHCEEDLSGAVAKDLAAAAADATLADAAAGKFPVVPPEVVRRFRLSTLLAFAIGIGLVLAAAFGGRGSGPGVVVAVFGWIVGVIAVLVGIGYLVNDLLLTGPAGLTTPKKAVKTYLKCLREKRWEYAFHLIAPRGREGERLRRGSTALRVEEDSIPLRRPPDLEEYWKPLIHTSTPTVRTVQVGPIVVVEEGKDRATARVTLTVTAYPQWVNILVVLYLIVALIVYVIIRKSESIELVLPLVRVDGRWYLLDAVPQYGTPESD